MSNEDNKNSKKSSSNKVVEFPVHKARLSDADNSVGAQPKKSNVSFELENKKTLASMSLFSILFVVYFANNQLMTASQTESKQGRSIASFGQPVKVVHNPAWEREKIKELSTPSNERQFAVRGERPSHLDNFLFGELEGKYKVKLDEGKLVEVEFNNVNSLRGTPQAINDRVKFLLNNKKLLAVNFEQIKFLKEESLANSTTEVYQLFGSNGDESGKVLFELDPNGNFLSMKVSN